MPHDNTQPDADLPPAYEPPPVYAPPPPYGAPAPPPAITAATGRGRRRRGLIGGAAGVVIIAGAVLAYVLFSSGSSGAKTPQAAVQRLLDAGMHDDVNKAASVLCAADRAVGQVSHLQSSGRITGYEIGAETTANGIHFVSASFATNNSATPTTERFPVIQEGGSWKVCFSREIATLPMIVPSGLPSDFSLPDLGGSAPAFPTDIPGGTAALCTGSTSGFGVASTYVGAAEIGVPQVAQGCVYQGQVPLSVTQRLTGKLFAPVTTDQNASVIVFQSTDGSVHVTVTTAKESDGHYYVTAVTIS